MKTSAILFAAYFATQIASSAGASAAHQSKQSCPAGYSVLVGVCIHDRTGDVVSLITERGQSKQRKADAQPRQK